MRARAKAAADRAAEQAKARMTEAAAHLVASVENAVARAGKKMPSVGSTQPDPFGRWWWWW